MNPLSLYELVKAANGIFRCVFRVGVLSPKHEGVNARWDRCEACPHVERDHGVASRCGVCGCWLKCLLRIPGASCPLGDARYPRTKHERPAWGPIDITITAPPAGAQHGG